MLRSVDRVPETHPSVGASRRFTEQDRVSRPIGDLVVADPAVQVEHAVVVRIDRRIDVVMAARIVDR